MIECHPVLEDLCGSVNDITVATGPGSVQHSRPHETVGAERVCMCVCVCVCVCEREREREGMGMGRCYTCQRLKECWLKE